MNKYLISVDIEGISGVSGKTFATQGSKNYELARKYMHSDVNAVISGILKQDPESQIIVRDAHGDAINLDLEKLHPRATLIQGWGSAMNMLEGLDKSFKGVFLVGYHAGGQNNEAVLGHTLSSKVHYLKVNSKLINEAGFAAICAGIYDVPIAFISGDDQAINEAINQFENAITVEVKKSLSRDSAVCLSLTETRKLLENGAEEATKKLQKTKISSYKLVLPATLELVLYNTGYRISIFERLAKILHFDKVYQFDAERFAIKYSAKSALEMAERLNLILQLVYWLGSN